ncbi:unnamed protein product [Calypogeia fissa]
MFVGFAGSIAGVNDPLEVIGWSFNSNGPAPDLLRNGDGTLFDPAVEARKRKLYAIIIIKALAPLTWVTVFLCIDDPVWFTSSHREDCIDDPDFPTATMQSIEFDESREIVQNLVDEYKACESADYIKWGMEDRSKAMTAEGNASGSMDSKAALL